MYHVQSAKNDHKSKEKRTAHEHIVDRIHSIAYARYIWICISYTTNIWVISAKSANGTRAPVIPPGGEAPSRSFWQFDHLPVRSFRSTQSISLVHMGLYIRFGGVFPAMHIY
jgi:hypothetical protein